MVRSAVLIMLISLVTTLQVGIVVLELLNMSQPTLILSLQFYNSMQTMCR